MRRIISTTLLAAALFISRGAWAQGEATTTSGGRGALGVGGVAMISGLAGPSLAFDAGAFHIEGLLAFSKVEDVRAVFGLGGRFWFKVHRTGASDFSVGGGLGFIHNGPADDDIVTLDGGVQARAFIVSNVALSVSMGLGVVIVDRTAVTIGPSPFGAAGVHYYF